MVRSQKRHPLHIDLEEKNSAVLEIPFGHKLYPCLQCTTADFSFAVSIHIRKPEGAVVDRAAAPKLSIGKISSRLKLAKCNFDFLSE